MAGGDKVRYRQHWPMAAEGPWRHAGRIARSANTGSPVSSTNVERCGSPREWWHEAAFRRNSTRPTSLPSSLSATATSSGVCLLLPIPWSRPRGRKDCSLNRKRGAEAPFDRTVRSAQFNRRAGMVRPSRAAAPRTCPWPTFPSEWRSGHPLIDGCPGGVMSTLPCVHQHEVMDVLEAELTRMFRFVPSSHAFTRSPGHRSSGHPAEIVGG